MDLGLKGRSALVGGASAGIGLECAQALVEEGANVVMVARRPEILEREAARLGATAVPGDVTEREDLMRAITTAIDTYGGLDIVVANAGGPPQGLATAMRRADLQEAVAQLLLPLVDLVELALPHLRASQQGRLVAITSTSVREPIANLTPSNAVRPGVVGYLKTLANELAPEGITVNSIAPGRIATARMKELFGPEPPASELAAIPTGRFGAAREVGDVVAFLCSRQAAYVTGTTIVVDGGLTRALF